jgi:hypothetical protein
VPSRGWGDGVDGSPQLYVIRSRERGSICFRSEARCRSPPTVVFNPFLNTQSGFKFTEVTWSVVWPHRFDAPKAHRMPMIWQKGKKKERFFGDMLATGTTIAVNVAGAARDL